MTNPTPEERAERCLLEPSGPGVNQLTKARIVAEIRAAVEAERKTWTREALRNVEDAALEAAALRIRTLSFAYDAKRHMGLPDPCAVLDEAAEKVLALKSSGLNG